MLTQSIEELKDKGLIRHRICNEPINQNQIKVDGRACINFTSNDYLGLSKHPKVIDACKNGFDTYGFGSGASALVSGYTSAQKHLEEQFSAMVGRPAALFFNSGYQANLALMHCFSDKQTTVVSDKLIHASLLDGIALSNCSLKRFPHLNYDAAEKILAKAPSHHRKILLSESIFSMEGDLVNAINLLNLAEKYQASLILDDAHGFGILGQNGLGVCEQYKLSINHVRLLSTPLGKAAGGMGAMISGSQDDIEYLLQFARSYRYSTALPPALATGLSKSLEMMEQEHWRREKLFENISFFNQQIKHTKYALISEDTTPIKSIMIGKNISALNLQQKLLNAGFFVSCIRPPTVPENTARLRITLNTLHKKEEIMRLLKCLDSY
jgi:8-amino-7-oxononanoate synthase